MILKTRPKGYKVKHCHDCSYQATKTYNKPCVHCWNIGNSGSDMFESVNGEVPFQTEPPSKDDIQQMLIEQLTFEVADLQKTVRLLNKEMTSLQVWFQSEMATLRATQQSYNVSQQQKYYRQWTGNSSGG